MEQLDGRPTIVGHRNYFIRHWRGELSLAKSVWVNSVALTLLCFLLSLPLLFLGLRYPLSPLNGWLTGFTFIVLMLALSIWQMVGTWRSARRHKQRGGKQKWAVVVRVLTLISVIYSGYVIKTDLYPAMKSGLLFVLNPQALPAHRITLLTPDELELAGGLSTDSLHAFEQALAENPHIKTVQLDSPGGSLVVSMAIARLIKEKGLDTYINADCLSGCTLVFSGGRQRWLGRQGRLGYHTASLYESGAPPEAILDMYRDFLQNSGVSRSFVDRVLNTASNDLWFPDAAELQREGIVTGLAEPGRFTDAKLARLKEKGQLDAYLRRITIFQLLSEVGDEFYPEELDAAAKVLEKTPTFAAFDATAHKRGNRLVKAYILDAPADAQLALWQAHLDTLLALQNVDIPSCAHFISGKYPRGVARSLVPDEVAKRLVDSLRELIRVTLPAPESAPPGKVAKADLDAIFSHLKDRWPLAVPYVREAYKHTADADTLCQVHVELYRQTLALPDPQRAADVLRLLVIENH